MTNLSTEKSEKTFTLKAIDINGKLTIHQNSKGFERVAVIGILEAAKQQIFNEMKGGNSSEK